MAPQLGELFAELCHKFRDRPRLFLIRVAHARCAQLTGLTNAMFLDLIEQGEDDFTIRNMLDG